MTSGGDSLVKSSRQYKVMRFKVSFEGMKLTESVDGLDVMYETKSKVESDSGIESEKIVGPFPKVDNTRKKSKSDSDKISVTVMENNHSSTLAGGGYYSKTPTVSLKPQVVLNPI